MSKRTKKHSLDRHLPDGIKISHTLQFDREIIPQSQLVWSPDGRRLAEVSADPSVRIWDLRSGRLNGVLRSDSSRIIGLTWSPEGDMICSCSDDDACLEVWDANDCVPIRRINLPKARSKHERIEYADCVAWSPEGSSVACGFESGAAVIDIESERVVRLRDERPRSAKDIIWTADGEIVIVNAVEDLRVFDASSGDLQSIVDFPASKHPRSLAISPDGGSIACASSDGVIGLFDQRCTLRGILEGHTATVTHVGFSSDGRLLISSSKDDTVRMWRTNDWEPVVTLQVGSKGEKLIGFTANPTTQ